MTFVMQPLNEAFDKDRGLGGKNVTFIQNDQRVIFRDKRRLPLP